MEKRPKISVIVPLFKVSQFVERCVESLMSQTFDDVEFIFVDDASPDDSVEKARRITERHAERKVLFLRHEVNSGLPASRRTGMSTATGEFIYHCDGDDYVEPTILEKLYGAAVESGADYVYCDYFLTFEQNERVMRNPHYSTPDEMLRKGYLMGRCKYNYWNKLVRRELYDGVEFPVGHRKGGEDMVQIGILSRAHAVAHVAEPLYHYVKTNGGAISEGFSQQRLTDIRYNASCALQALESYPGDLSMEKELFKLNVKLQFIITGDRRKYLVWKEWFPEANKYIFRNTELPLRTKLVQWFAAKDLWLLVKAYYLIVFKFVYGVIYR